MTAIKFFKILYLKKLNGSETSKTLILSDDIAYVSINVANYYTYSALQTESQ